MMVKSPDVISALGMSVITTSPVDPMSDAASILTLSVLIWRETKSELLARQCQ